MSGAVAALKRKFQQLQDVANGWTWSGFLEDVLGDLYTPSPLLCELLGSMYIPSIIIGTIVTLVRLGDPQPWSFRDIISSACCLVLRPTTVTLLLIVLLTTHLIREKNQIAATLQDMDTVQGNVPSISLLLLALPIWMAVQSCECAEEGWLYIGMSTAGCGLLLIPAIYSCVVPSVDHLQIYCFSQAARYTRMAAVKLASVLGMKDPKVLVTVLKRLQMLLVSWLLQKPLFLIAKGGTRVYIAGFAGCTLLSLVKQLGAPPVTCTAQQVARAGTSLQLLKASSHDAWCVMSVWAKSLGCSAQAIKSRVVAGIAHHGPRVAWIVGMQTYAALKTLLLYISTAACSLALAVRNLLVSEWFCSFVRHAVSAMLALLCAAMTAVFQHRSEGHAAEERIQVNQDAASDSRCSPWSNAMTSCFIKPDRVINEHLLRKRPHCKVYCGWLIIDANQRAKVVTKVFDGINSVATHAALEQRVQVLRDCQHVCQIFGVSCVEQKACIVMEQHQSLAEVLTHCPGRSMPTRHMVKCMHGICQGLHELHSAGIIMRELKPENVLISDDGISVLADFGLVHAITGSASQCYDKIGTGAAKFRAPETILGSASGAEHAISDKADIWALGCMLLEMWVGCSWTHAVFTTKIFSAPPYAGLLPESLANIIRMCLDQVPQDRPTAMEVQQVLQTLGA